MKKNKRKALHIPKSSIILDLNPILMARNIKTPFSYLLKIGFSSVAASKILKKDAIQINFKQLTSLCLNLNCTPNDLFFTRDMSLPTHHELNLLTVYSNEALPTVDDFLNSKSLSEVQGLLANN